MRPLTKIIYLLISILLVGCAAPEAVKKEASSQLNSICYKLFTDGGIDSYGHCNLSQQWKNSCAFAYAYDGKRGACGWVSATRLRDDMCLFDCLPTKTELGASAIAICQEMADKNRINASCKIYAFDYDIVYGKTENVDFQ
jgi:hypothetical protein